MPRTNERRGFLTKEAAEDYQMRASLTPPYSSVHPACRGAIYVTDPSERAGGRVHVWSYRARSKKGEMRTYFASCIGA